MTYIVSSGTLNPTIPFQVAIGQKSQNQSVFKMSSRSGLALLGHRLCRRQVFEVTLSALCDRRRKVTRKRKKAMLEFCSCSNLMASADRTSDTVLCHARTRRYRRRRLLSYLVQNKLLDAHKSPALCLSARTLFVTATLGVPAGRNSTISAH